MGVLYVSLFFNFFNFIYFSLFIKLGNFFKYPLSYIFVLGLVMFLFLILDGKFLFYNTVYKLLVHLTNKFDFFMRFMLYIVKSAEFINNNYIFFSLFFLLLVFIPQFIFSISLFLDLFFYLSFHFVIYSFILLLFPLFFYFVLYFGYFYCNLKLQLYKDMGVESYSIEFTRIRGHRWSSVTDLDTIPSWMLYFISSNIFTIIEPFLSLRNFYIKFFHKYYIFLQFLYIFFNFFCIYFFFMLNSIL